MIHVITQFYRGKIGSVAEIGSAHGRDADFLARSYGVPADMVHIVEPRPDAAAHIRENFPSYHTHQIACSDRNAETMNFYISHHLEGSSLRDREMAHEKSLHHSKITVGMWRWEDYADAHGLPALDLVKIDVEGCTYDVLQGMGRFRNMVKVYHLECEDVQFWEGQKLTGEVLDMMPEYITAWVGGNEQKDVILVHKDHKENWHGDNL